MDSPADSCWAAPFCAKCAYFECLNLGVQSTRDSEVVSCCITSWILAKTDRWVVENDRMEIAAGGSSSDVRLRKTIPVR